MLTVRSEIGPYQKPPGDLQRSPHLAKAPSVRKKRFRLPTAVHSWAHWAHEHDDEHKDKARKNIDNYFFKFPSKRLTNR
jgi:hypothetical protein